MFRSMPFILLVLILSVICLDSFIPISLKQILYSISLSVKSSIIFILPVIIFCLLFKAMVNLSNSATKIIGLILILVCCSNFVTTFLSHYVGIWVYNFDLSMMEPKESSGLEPLWSFNLPSIIANNHAMFSAIIMGLLFSKIYKDGALKVSIYLEKFLNFIFKILVYVIPVFVIGFIVKLQHDAVILTIIKDYSVIFIVVALTQVSYIAIIFLLLNDIKIKDWFNSIKNMLPAAIIGFSTMSSAASMPMTIIGVEKNAKNKAVASSVVPATVNIHLIGDCIAIPVFAYAVLKSFGMPEPSLFSYLIFAFYFVLAKFSVAAIPGGGIIVMLPILEKYLGFNADMMSIITALYILFDPVITCTNILGNGAFAKLTEKSVALINRERE